MNDLDQDRYAVTTQFRHDHGGSWEITKVDAANKSITIKAMPGTTVKHKALLLGRNFKIFGGWFKITDCNAQTITLQKKPRKDQGSRPWPTSLNDR